MRALPLDQHLRRLDALLSSHEWLWREAPFRVLRPAWCDRLPALERHVRTFDDATVERLSGDNHALIALLAQYVPAVAELTDLIAFPIVSTSTTPIADRHFAWEIPGRKRAQIEAFAAAVMAHGGAHAPVVEWCAGAGHLGRLAAHLWPRDVESIEINPTLAATGRALALRARSVRQTFTVADVLGPLVKGKLKAKHALALHACGDLHRALIEQTVVERAHALDLAPCCYHLMRDVRYKPFSAHTTLALTRDEVRLAVTETTTASTRDRRRRDLELAWKLGFIEWRVAIEGERGRASFKTVPSAWFRGTFVQLVERLAAREGVALWSTASLKQYEAVGWQRRSEVARLSLVRHAFRRALEVWLVLDRACALETAGYTIHVSEFCARSLTPRNLLISAR